MAKLSHLLLYDPDPSGLETLSYVFSKEGCKVGGTSDKTKFPALVQAEGPPLVLVALREPEQAAVDLVRDIAINPRTRNVACVAIGPTRWRGPVLQAGGFGLLAAPVFLRDVLDVAKLVAAATVPGSRPSPDTEVTLPLSELGGVYYLIRALAASGRSAAVEISRGAKRGELRFIDGELSSVQIGGLSGMAALHQALLWEEADLRLKFRNIVRRAGQLSLKSDELIEECDRFLRDFAHDVKDLGVAGTVYRPSSDARPTSSLPSEVVPLLRLFDGSRTLGQVLEESPFRVFDTLRIVHQFAAAEAIRADAVPAPRSPTALPGPAALAPWFQQASQQLSQHSSRQLSAQPSSAEQGRGAPARPVEPPRPPGRAPIVEQRTAAAERAVPQAGNAHLPEEDRPTPPPALIEPDRLAREPQRPSSPFTPIGQPAGAPSGDGSGIPRAMNRTLTRREYPIKNPAASARAAGEPSKPVPVAKQADATTPPMLAGADSMEATPPPAAPSAERPRVPSSGIARGEIQVAAPVPLNKKIDKGVRPSAPSVLVELGAVPQPRAAVPIVEAPLTAQHAPPSVVAVPPATNGPLLRKKTPVPGSAEPSHRTRTPSSGFSAVESDFFEREADLYKRESVETFEDLENGVGPQRDSARKP